MFVALLLRDELRALVGVQEIVSTVGASAFSSALYSTLAVGLSLDEAVSWGRQKLLLQTFQDKQSYEWGSFMVYMPSATSVLLPRRGDRLGADQGRVLDDRKKTVQQASLPLPESVLVVETLAGLLPGEFETVVTGLGIDRSKLGGPDPLSRANDVYRLADRDGRLAVLRMLIARYK